MDVVYSSSSIPFVAVSCLSVLICFDIFSRLSTVSVLKLDSLGLAKSRLAMSLPVARKTAVGIQLTFYCLFL